MAITLNEINVGDIVRVRTDFGMGPVIRAIVEDICDDVKNGRPGIDYKTMDGEGYWCYLDQVVSIVR